MQRPSVRWPAEWEAHQSTLIAWPYSDMKRFKNDFARAIYALMKGERVIVFCGESKRDDCRTHLRSAGCTEVTDDSDTQLGSQPPGVSIVRGLFKTPWLRDAAPLTVHVEGKRKMLWFEMLENRKANEKNIQEVFGLKTLRPNAWMEGGAIDGNGQGTAIVSAEALIDRCRQFREDARAAVKKALGLRHIIDMYDLNDGDGCQHIDLSCRFVGVDQIATCVEKNSKRLNYASSHRRLEALQRETLPDGRPLRIIKLPFPEPIERSDKLVPASYANFYVGNSAVIVPQFGKKSAKKDGEVMEILAEQFPGREMVSFPGEPYARLGGGIHCLTMQIPAEESAIQ